MSIEPLASLVAKSEAHMAAFIAAVGREPDAGTYLTMDGGVAGDYWDNTVVATPDGRFLLDCENAGVFLDMDTVVKCILAYDEMRSEYNKSEAAKWRQLRMAQEHGV